MSQLSVRESRISPLGSTAPANSCPSTHTKTFIDKVSTTMPACDLMDDIEVEKDLINAPIELAAANAAPPANV